VAGADDAHPDVPNVRTTAARASSAPTGRPRASEANRRRERGITGMALLLS
jgi:hypothetical protein